MSIPNMNVNCLHYIFLVLLLSILIDNLAGFRINRLSSYNAMTSINSKNVKNSRNIMVFSTPMKIQGNNNNSTLSIVPIDPQFQNENSDPQKNPIIRFTQRSGLFMKRFISVFARVAISMRNIQLKKNSKPMLTGAGGKDPNRRNNNNNNNKLIKMLQQFKVSVINRKFITRFVLGFIGFIMVKKYLSFAKSLTTELSFTMFLKVLSDNPTRIQRLRVTPFVFQYLLDGRAAMTRVVSLEPALMDRLLASGVDFAAPAAPKNVIGTVWGICYALFLWKITTKMLQGPQDDGAGKTREKMNLNVYGDLSFDDVAGQDAAKLEVKEVCEMLKNPEKYSSVGARLPSGVLLVGPPGSGKTLMARVTASEAKVPFYACSASDFVEVYVGRGPARVRKLFKQAAETAPSIVFIDEIDSIGRSRKMGSLNSEQETTLNQILTCMDGLDTSNNGVIVMAATNRLELLDQALLRAGRFDRIINCPLPDRAGRYAILKVHTKKLILETDVDLDRIAKFTPGTSGADLSAICNEAAIRTVRRGSARISSSDFDGALTSFYSARTIPFTGLSDAAPSWLRGIMGNNS